jgi:SAM-dependent methyltransferase/uncharacterized protein YbaR (Trm112 family)
MTLKAFSRENGEIREGLLECTCGQWFPIIRSVPRMLLDEYRGDYRRFLNEHGLKRLKNPLLPKVHRSPRTQVQKSFSSKWTSQPLWGTHGETKTFMKEWMLEKYGWGDLKSLGGFLKRRRSILDAGTGLGREAVQFAELCPAGDVFGIDLSEAVDAAYAHTRRYPNIHIVQADIARLPFRKNVFDFIFSEGVLHHTPDTQSAFKALLRHLAPGGEMAFYVYRKKGPIREFCDDYLRQVTVRLSDEECWAFSRKMTELGRTLSHLKVEFEISGDISEIRIKAGKYNLQRFFYYHVMKCFWNDSFSFDENNLINFDWYHPVYAHRHTPEEVKGWLRKANLKVTHFDVSESGITARGVREP